MPPAPDIDTALVSAEYTFASLTFHTGDLSAQVRKEGTLDGGEVTEHTVLAVKVFDTATRSKEIGNPAILDADTARQLRDLLNFATARGYL